MVAFLGEIPGFSDEAQESGGALMGREKIMEAKASPHSPRELCRERPGQSLRTPSERWTPAGKESVPGGC